MHGHSLFGTKNAIKFTATGIDRVRCAISFTTQWETRMSVVPTSSIFDEIQQLYAKCHRDGIDYQDRAATFAVKFADWFRDYISAPQSYVVTTDGVKQETKRYVETIKVIKNSSGKYQPACADIPLHIVTRIEDGHFLFGLRLVLEPAKGCFPRYNFVFVVKIRIKENVCELELVSLGKSFRFDLSDEKARAAVYDTLIDVLKKELRRPPWDDDSIEEKQQIGFLRFSD
jgi:hypothetical protein